jgi:peptidyl-dipeptidase A
MLARRSSPPWQGRFHEVTGTWQIDASAIMDYSAPLRGWLAEQNHRQQCGW